MCCLCNGYGEQFIAEINIDKIIKKLNLDATTEHFDINNINHINDDYYVLREDLYNSVPKGLRSKVIIVSNFVNVDEMAKTIVQESSHLNKDGFFITYFWAKKKR